MKKEINTKTDQELIQEVAEKRTSLNGMKFNIAGSKIKNVREQRGVKKDIARHLTELNKRAS
jgi:ribosomal protein L29